MPTVLAEAAEPVPENASHLGHRRNSSVTSSKLESWETAICGASAGLVSRFVIAPLDVVKIRLQLQTQRPDYSIQALAHRLRISRQDVVATKDVPVKYTGMLQGMRLIVREEGITGLWKGNLPAEYLYLTYGASQFYAYHKLEDIVCDLDSQNRLPPTLRALLSGALAGSFATALTYPFDLLRTRFAVQGEERMYSSILQAFRNIYTEEGVRGFYRGVVPSMVQIMPYMGLMFGSFDALKGGIGWLKIHHYWPSTSVTLDDMFCGALAGVFSKVGVFPMDLVRKRLQVQGPRRTGYVIPAPQYSASMFVCMRQVVKHEGFLALYKGLVPGIVKAAPACAATFLVYGKTREVLEWWKSTKEKSTEVGT